MGSLLAVSGVPPLRLRFARAVCCHVQPFGAGKLRHALYRGEIARRDDTRFVARALTGSLFAGTTSDYHAYVVAVQGYGEWRLWAVALAVCRPGEVVAEVGANVGSETVGYSDIVGPAGRVLAFEPLASNRRSLEGNLTLLQHPNVTIYPYALGDKPGTVPFAAPPPGGSSGIGHVLGPEERESRTVTYRANTIQSVVESVDLRTLDSVVEADVRLLVMDAEGSELAILRGARGLVARSAPVIVLEANPWHQRRAGADLPRLHAELHELGYRTFEMGLLTLTEIAKPRTTAAVQTWVSLPASQAHLASHIAHMMRRCALTPCIGNLSPLSVANRRGPRHDDRVHRPDRVRSLQSQPEHGEREGAQSAAGELAAAENIRQQPR